MVRALHIGDGIFAGNFLVCRFVLYGTIRLNALRNNRAAFDIELKRNFHKHVINW